jgi:hypothetical protein
MNDALYPWEAPDAPEHVRVRQPVMEIHHEAGIRWDLPKRRNADELPRALQGEDFGIVIMTHRGSSNGRLSVLLSSIPENYPVVVSSDSVAPRDVELDMEVALHHGADFAHCSPWGGRARNARHCMERTSWRITLFLCDDVWLFPETCSQALRWFCTLERHGIPLASLAVPGWETYREHTRWGFESWNECLVKPWKFEAVPPNPAFQRCPALFKNPFGACFVINRNAYTELGGFTPSYWAHDDVWNHQVWTSGKWVSAGYPGRGYMHLGAQSWHHGESVKYVGEFKDATGMTADESGKLQVESIYRWKDRLGHIFLSLGGTEAV